MLKNLLGYYIFQLQSDRQKIPVKSTQDIHFEHETGYQDKWVLKKHVLVNSNTQLTVYGFIVDSIEYDECYMIKIPHILSAQEIKKTGHACRFTILDGFESVPHAMIHLLVATNVGFEITN